MEKLLCDGEIFQIYEGASQMRRLTIGRALLKESIQTPDGVKASAFQT